MLISFKIDFSNNPEPDTAAKDDDNEGTTVKTKAQKAAEKKQREKEKKQKNKKNQNQNEVQKNSADLQNQESTSPPTEGNIWINTPIKRRL